MSNIKYQYEQAAFLKHSKQWEISIKNPTDYRRILMASIARKMGLLGGMVKQEDIHKINVKVLPVHYAWNPLAPVTSLRLYSKETEDKIVIEYHVNFGLLDCFMIFGWLIILVFVVGYMDIPKSTKVMMTMPAILIPFTKMVAKARLDNIIDDCIHEVCNPVGPE